MHPIPDILEALRRGKMIVLVDDEQRENEGDLVCAAEYARPQIVNFMLREGRGMMCVALGGEICDRLKLEPQSRINTSLHSTAYTVTVDAAQHYGVTTGVSAGDRATTIQRLAAPSSEPADFDRPGHMQPLRARDGGSLVRAGQTEGSVDLCRLAGLNPAAVIIEVMNEDGSMARRDDLEKLCQKHDLKMCSVADVIHHRLTRDKLVQRLDTVPFENDIGQFNLVAYESAVDPFPHVALTCGDVGQLDDFGQSIDIEEPVLVRMHSQNLLGDVFDDLTQPSGRTLRQAMSMIHRQQRGALVYLRHEGMGSGLLKRLQTARDERSAAPVDIGANQPSPGIYPPRNAQGYGIGSQILRDLGIRQLKLITNHPFTPTGLSGFGLSVAEFVPVPEDD